jgi:hypothetical protein
MLNVHYDVHYAVGNEHPDVHYDILNVHYNVHLRYRIEHHDVHFNMFKYVMTFIMSHFKYRTGLSTH